MRMTLTLSAVVLLLGQTMQGCPQMTPPFDASGYYSGTWAGQAIDMDADANPVTGATPQLVFSCPLVLTLAQNVTAATPGNFTITGVVNIDYSCVTLPDRFTEAPPSTVELHGVLQPDGKLSLASATCDTTAGSGICVGVVFDGQGTDVDSDGHMDTYTGNWHYVLLMQGVQPFGAYGTFAEAVAAQPQQ